MKDRIIVITALIVALTIVSTTVAPARAFVYPSDPEDNYFELFGPRIDELLIKKYNGLDAEMTALQNGEIDITDSSLTKTWVDNFTSDPNIGMLKYGGEAGYYTINFNHNNNTHLGNPEDPAYPNPVYPNPTSMASLRQALAHMIDREALCNGAGQGLYESIYTPIAAYMTYWIHPDIKPGGTFENLTYPPSIASAEAILNAGGFPMGLDGWRYWDMDEDGEKDEGEDFTLKIGGPRTHLFRLAVKDMLCAGLDTVHIKWVDLSPWAFDYMALKSYHIYLAGWIFVGPDPDYLYDLYHWNNYYHPEDPPNMGAISKHDPLMQGYLEEIEFASDQQAALNACLSFQERFADVAAEIPLASSSAPKAYNKWYTGGNDGQTDGGAEDKYRGQPWTQIVNERGEGENSAYTTLNAYPGTFRYGDGSMTMRYGWKDGDMPMVLNPLGSSWYWEWEVLDRIYDRLVTRDPMTKGPAAMSSLVENWTIGTWTDPRDGFEKTKIRMIIRSDVSWSDGTPFTVDDVVYNLYEKQIQLREKGVPDAWCAPDYRILCCYKIDSYTADVLLKSNCTWQVPCCTELNDWFGIPIMPKHIWQPYIASHTVAEITGDMSMHPGMLVGTGPFKFVENTATTLKLIRNPLYHQIMDKAIVHFGHFDEHKSMKGITVSALSPSIQLSPFKIQVDALIKGYAHITVPVTNLDVNDQNIIRKKIELVHPNGTVQTLVDETGLTIEPLEIHTEEFDVSELSKGWYTVRVTVEVTAGSLHDWVVGNLPPELYLAILGPRTVEKRFSLTAATDLDEDGFVDIFDIVIVASAFGSIIGDSGYDPRADLNQDGYVDIFDIVRIALSFGWG
jgi:ABC-type transport system substrate-binding protein